MLDFVFFLGKIEPRSEHLKDRHIVLIYPLSYIFEFLVKNKENDKISRKQQSSNYIEL